MQHPSVLLDFLGSWSYFGLVSQTEPVLIFFGLGLGVVGLLGIVAGGLARSHSRNSPSNDLFRSKFKRMPPPIGIIREDIWLGKSWGCESVDLPLPWM